jgi:hypothetical protein
MIMFFKLSQGQEPFSSTCPRFLIQVRWFGSNVPLDNDSPICGIILSSERRVSRATFRLLSVPFAGR